MSSVEQRLASLERMLEAVARKQDAFHHAITNLEKYLVNALENLQAQVAASNSVTDSALTLIVGLQAKLDAAIAAAKSGDNHAALDALSADLIAHTAALSAAVQANTPSTGTATPGVGVEPAPVSTTTVAAGDATTAETSSGAAVDGAAASSDTQASTGASDSSTTTGASDSSAAVDSGHVTTEPQTGTVSGQ